MYFTPGAVLGGLIGWLIADPINAVLRKFFKLFNAGFDRLVNGYGRVVGGLLRISGIALVAYGGLLVVTYWQFNRTPTGFVPQQDKGYLLLNVQLPDSASVERTGRVMARIEQVAHDTPGVEHTVGVAGQSLILNANAPNLASMYVILKPFDERREQRALGHAIATDLQQRCARPSSRRHRHDLRRAADRRPGNDRRLQDDCRRPRQRGAGVSCSATVRKSSPAAIGPTA